VRVHEPVKSHAVFSREERYDLLMTASTNNYTCTRECTATHRTECAMQQEWRERDACRGKNKNREVSDIGFHRPSLVEELFRVLERRTPNRFADGVENGKAHKIELTYQHLFECFSTC
jgi:hypothetical protein